MSDCYERALSALMSQAISVVIDAVSAANKADNSDETIGAPRVIGLLHALHDSYADALMVIMYAGRGEYDDGHPYDEFAIETQFHEWWDYLGMDGEHFVREQMSEKWPLGDYLRKGAYMFRIETGR